jgi:uncharacterized membrane protein YsdA (DUF1294 family)
LIRLIRAVTANLMLHYVPHFLLLVNAWTLFRFWQDKARAIDGARRIPEADLLGLALIGGSPAAFLGRHLFRHKTRKEPFSTQLKAITVLQIVAIAAYVLTPPQTKSRLVRLAMTQLSHLAKGD